MFTSIRPSEWGSPRALLIIADGIGKEGKICSQLAIDTIYAGLQDFLNQIDPEITVAQEVHPAELLKTSVEMAHKAIRDRWQRPNVGVASTVTCVLIDNQLAIIANVGDNRAYHLRNGELKQITEDHSYVNHLVKLGELSPEEARIHPQRNVIYNALGWRADVQVDVFTQPLQIGDLVLLCNDGLYHVVDETMWKPFLLNTDSADAIVERLINAVKEAGGFGDTSVIAAKVMADTS